MAGAPNPINESDRIAELQSYEILDTQCEESFDDLTRLAARLIDCPISAISMIDTHRQWFKAQVGLDIRETPRTASFCAYAILQDEPLVVVDAAQDDRFRDNPLVTGDPAIRFYAGVPLCNPQGFRLGTLCVIDRRPRELSADQIDTLVSLARTAMTTLELHRAMNQVRTLALTDPLTGIANRSAFLGAVDRAIARQQRHYEPFTLIYLDLDGFKQVNDNEGHAAGDQVLCDIAAALTANSRAEDLAARIGGDEFAVLISGDDCTDAHQVGERIRAAVLAAMKPGGRSVTASLGSVCFRCSPADAVTALSVVDKLMYSAKHAGKNRVTWVCHDAQPTKYIAA
jgi:diguanylate cyclase (GGDEF)-like protein